jgi:acyl carrier protein
VELQDVFAEILGVERSAIRPETVQGEIPEWDSVGHLNLMLGLEDRFGVSFDVDDLTRLNSVEAILVYLNRACASS